MERKENKNFNKKKAVKVTTTLALCTGLAWSPLGFVHANTGFSQKPVSIAHGPMNHPLGNINLPKNVLNPKFMDVNTHWIQLGPSPITGEYGDNGAPRSDSGRVASIAISENKNLKTVYVGAANGGVWSSINDGTTWKPLTDDQVTLATGSVAVDPNNPNTVYVGTGEQHFSADSRYGRGILKSTDSGKSWTTLGSDVFGGYHIGKVAVDPNDSSKVWVAADNGLYQSIDAGQTWNKMWSAQGKPTDVYIVKNNPGVIYMSVAGSGIYKSTNGGKNFTLLGQGTLPNYNTNPLMYNASLAVVEGATGQQDTIYSSYSDGNGNLMGMFKSTDSGVTWDRLTNVPQYFDSNYSYYGDYDAQHPSGQGWYDNVIAVDPTNPQHIIAGGITLIESLDGGTSWKSLDTFFNAKQGDINTHPDQHIIVFDSQGNAYVGNDGGVFKESTDGKWHNLNSNLNTVTFYPGLTAFNGGNFVMGGAQDNGTNLYSGQKAWLQETGGDGGYTYVDPQNPNFMLAEFQYGRILKSEDGGQNWDYAYPKYQDPGYLEDEGAVNDDEDGAAPFVTPFTASSLDNGKYEVIVGADRVYKSTNNGNLGSYVPISPKLDTAAINTVSQSKTNPNVIYVGTAKGDIYVTFTGGGTDPSAWHKITRTGKLDARAYVAAIAINPTNDNEITVTYSNTGYYSPESTNHVFYCPNTNTTNPVWTNVSAKLPATYAPSVTYLGQSVIVGTEQGVFIAKPGSDEWSKLGKDLPNVPVTSVVYAGNGKLVVGTYGRGAFRLELGQDAKHLAGLK
ncbi:hypothetical protein [Neobacillus massiliamazoniensis]|uniref:Xyloglucanase n=1 Tax=Neobacillus massiliamazoniensis TaxID=1499688 RepID=A0A0U1P3A7_9BACI|nr:hypothetical protein [Neobacillus massiliamazoniensis]CRK84628.1 Xyloglucanase precursor [Neobacillus massiliamazoniensis]